jgi:O-antigen/teichoic acid export membrane protein
MKSIVQEWQRIRQSAVARNAGWMMAGQGTGFILQAVYFVVLARLLGAEQYGIFAGAFAFTSLVSQYSALGTGTVLLRYVSNDRNVFAVYWGNLLLVTLTVGSLLVLILHFIAPHALNPASAALVLLAGIANCLCAQLTTETARVFQTFEKMRITAVLALLTNLLRTLAAAGLLFFLHRCNAWQWALASVIVSAISAVAAVIVVIRNFGWPAFSPKLFVTHGWEGLGYSFASSTASVYNDIDKTMLSHYNMNLATGIYSMAYRVIDIATIPILAIRDAALPRLFQRGASGLAPTVELAQRLLRRALPVSALISVVLFLSAPLIPHMVGHGFAQSVSALRWLCLIPVFRSVHQMTGSALLGAGLQWHRTAAQMAAAAFNFCLNLYLIPRYGWHGAAWSSLATDGALGVTNWLMLRILVARSVNKPQYAPL